MRRRRRFFPILILTIPFWAGWFYIVFKIPPTQNSYYLFFLLLFLALFLTFFLLFKSRRQAFILSMGATIFLILRLLHLANILNLIILASLIVVAELYLRQPPRQRSL